jgi:hypothetical protein
VVLLRHIEHIDRLLKHFVDCIILADFRVFVIVHLIVFNVLVTAECTTAFFEVIVIFL